jgi:predicted NodU family carbamoyl transferase
MNILGISLQHDAGAAIIGDGRIIAAINEERLNRQKLYWGWPEL